MTSRSYLYFGRSEEVPNSRLTHESIPKFIKYSLHGVGVTRRSYQP